MADNKWEEVPEEELVANGWEETTEDTLTTDGWEEVPEKEAPSATESYLGGAFQDLSFGLIDELKGGLEAGGQAIGVKGLGKEFGEQEFQEPVGLDLEKLLEVYRGGRDEERSRHKGLQEESPSAYKAGEYTGMVAPVIASGGAGAIKGLLGAGGKKLAKKAGVEVAQEVGEQAIKQNMGTLAKTGAGFGAAGAAGYSETDALQEPGQLAKEMATGAALGATAGVVLPEAMKLGVKGVKKLGRGIKEGSKQILSVFSGLEKESIDEIIKRSDDIKNVISYPEIQEIVVGKTKQVHDNIGKLAESGKKILSEEKTIPKEILVQQLRQRIKEVTGKAEESAIPQLQRIIDRLEPLTPERAIQEANERLTAKLAKKKLEGDVVQGSQRQAEKALNKIKDKQAKMIAEAQEVGERVNFSSPKLEEGRIVVFETTTGKVLSEKVQPLKRVAKFSEPKVDMDTGLIHVENLNTGEIISETVAKVASEEPKYAGKLLSQRDLQEITQDIGNRAYVGVKKDAEGAVAKELRKTYRIFSEALKENAPDEYRPIAKEISDRYTLLDKIEDKLGIKIDYDTPVIKSEDRLATKLQEVGQRTKGREKTDVESLLKELEDTQGKLPTEKSLGDILSAKRLETELNSKPSEYSYQARTILGSGIGAVAGGGVGAVVGTAAGLAARPVSRSLIRSGKLSKLTTLPSLAAKVTDKLTQETAPFVFGAAVKKGSKASEELAESDYLEALIGDLEASEIPSAQGLAEDVKGTFSEDSQTRAASEYKIQSDPNARKYLNKHREGYKKKPNAKPEVEYSQDLIDSFIESEGQATYHDDRPTVELKGLKGPKNRRIEGSSEHGLYYDSEGYLTAGYGDKITSMSEAKQKMNQDVDAALVELKKNIKTHEKLAKSLLKKKKIDFTKMSTTQRDAVTEMVFQMGYGNAGKFSTLWKALKSALESGNYSDIEKSVKHSIWNKQSPNRVEKFIKNITTVKEN